MLQKIRDELHLYEKKVLKGLEKLGYEASPEAVSETEELNIKAVMSAAGSLSNKDLIEVNKDVDKVLSLGIEGEKYAKQGLPEKRILQVLKEGEIPLKEVGIRSGLPPQEMKIALGWLRRKNWASIDKGMVKITDKGREALSKEYADELLLQKLTRKKWISLQDLFPVVREGFEILKKRKGIIRVDEKATYTLKVTDKGKRILDMGLEIREEATQLTHEQLKTGAWKDITYRPYDIYAEYPEFFPGKIHPLQRTIEDIRHIFLNLGFTESRGSILESAFWNFDCLFQPQDHAAREMQDTFYIKKPQYTQLPSEELVEKVCLAHEEGGETGSTGWGYTWDVEVARQSVLRTHTTCVSARFLAENKPPLKMFSVGKVFRRETITYKHLPEFHQVEGIVAAEDINFRHLLGILKEFYAQLGFRVRFRPAYFPYTYLSTECEIYLPEKKSWIELGGAGMFRPEVLEPLQVETEVLAFGLGIERLAMLRLGIKDIRMLYQSDMGWLRHLPLL